MKFLIEKIMNYVAKFFQGKWRGYFIIGVSVLGAGYILLTPAELSDIPNYVWLILVDGLGLAVVRSFMSKVSEYDNKGWKAYFVSIVSLTFGALHLAGIEINLELTERIIDALTGSGLLALADGLRKLGILGKNE